MLISYAVTAKLICAFAFAYEEIRFSHDVAQIVIQKSSHSLMLVLGSRIHLSNVLTDHMNILTYIKAWPLLNNMYYTMP